MTPRNLLILAAWLVCLGSVSAVLFGRSQINDLRTTGSKGVQLSSSAAVLPDTDTLGRPSSTNVDASLNTSRELMQLRAEVTRLTARKRELANVVETSTRLRAQLANSQANSGGLPLPAGYLRRASARFRGFSTPEATLESWLWALHNHDFANMLRALSPEQLPHVRSSMAAEHNPADFFKDTDVLPGLAVQSRRDLPDGSVELQVVLAPGMPPQNVQFHLLNGEWKMAEW